LDFSEVISLQHRTNTGKRRKEKISEQVAKTLKAATVTIAKLQANFKQNIK
jgi:hypothetical protein